MPELSTKPLEKIVCLVTEKVSGQKDQAKPYVGLEHLPSRGSMLIGSIAAEESISINNTFRTGDILFGKLRPRLRKSVRAPFDGYCSTDILVLRAAADVHPVFAGFVLQSDAVFSEAVRTEEGTKMPRCSWGMLRKFRVFCPEGDEQGLIAEVLSSVDAAIEQTDAVIAKAQQVKAGMLHDLFTRGLTPEGCLRPLRAERPDLYHFTKVGWAPRDWSQVTVDTCGTVKLGRQLSPCQLTGRWTTPYLRVANVFDGFIDYSDVLSMDFTPAERETFSLRHGDILLNEGQSLELVGRCALYDGSDGEYCFQNTLIRFRPGPGHHPAFYRWLFKRFLDTGRFMTIAHQTTSVAHLGADRLARLPCPEVTPDEQERIADRLDAVQAPIERHTAAKVKLEAVKSGLMHDLLTGSVRVSSTARQRVRADV
jgi:type I restriction enzyme S subunit